MKKASLAAFLLVMILVNGVKCQEIQPLFDYWKFYTGHANVLYNHLADLALDKLDRRRAEIAGLHTGADWKRRQEEVRETLHRIIGDFPEKTPLNPRITRTLKGKGFHVEKVIYESQPGFYVTAALFIPDNLKGKAPGVLYCSGHTFESFRSKVYQHMIINLVNKGCVVLAFDPIGQGERQQYLDEEGKKSIFSTPTHEHSYPGGQCFVSGSSLARIMIWDGIRSVDYLLTRPEVDPGRIGITGRSGGGTQSAYIAAFDPRITVAAPECYITGFSYIFRSIGPQDAEQNFPGFIEQGLDLPDLLEVRAPGPALIISTTRDFFSIQGARDTYHEVRDAYQRMGYADRISMSEDDAEHETTLKNRKALYSFFGKYLNMPGDTADLDVELFEPEALQVTTTGQVIPELNGETTFSLNKKMSLLKLDEKKRQPETNIPDRESLKVKITGLTGYDPPAGPVNPVFSGRMNMNGFILEKYLVPGGGAYFLPVLVLKPESRQNGKSVVLLNPGGKEKEITGDSLAQWFLRKGCQVVVPDIAGFGELGPGYLTGDAYMDHTSYNQWFAGILTGKSPVGLRMGDISRIAEFINGNLSTGNEQIYAVGRDVLAADLLHQAAISNIFSRIMLINPLVSYRALVLNERYHPRYIQSAVRGSVGIYDLPDLALLAAPDKLLMIDVCDQEGNVLEDPSENEDILTIQTAFDENNQKGYFEVKKSTGKSYEELAGSWLE